MKLFMWFSNKCNVSETVYWTLLTHFWFAIVSFNSLKFKTLNFNKLKLILNEFIATGEINKNHTCLLTQITPKKHTCNQIKMCNEIRVCAEEAYRVWCAQGKLSVACLSLANPPLRWRISKVTSLNCLIADKWACLAIVSTKGHNVRILSFD